MNLVKRLKRWWQRSATSHDDAGWAPMSMARRPRQPSPYELLAELKSTAWACATINASVCASLPPRLYVTIEQDRPRPRCLTRAVDARTERGLAAARNPRRRECRIEEVVDHPFLDLLRFDLLEITQLALEVHGCAYWLLDVDPMGGEVRGLWPLPTHLVTPRREPNSPRIVDAFEYRGSTTQRFEPGRVVHFRCPDPRDPFTSGLSPLKACFDQAALVSEFANLKRTVYDNAALPSVLISADEGLAPEERDRLERQWTQKMRGSQGGAIVADSSLKVTVLSQSMGDLSALADVRASKEDIANAFQVPIPFLTGETNLANMQTADHLHKSLAIVPRLRRRDEKLNEQLIPHIDPTGRFFFATPDPTPDNQAFVLQQEQADLRAGVRTINEIRAARGLPPVAWGETPRR